MSDFAVIFPYWLLRSHKGAVVPSKQKLSKRELYDRKNERRRALYAQRKAQGVCVQCGKAPANGGSPRCSACLDRRSARSKQQREDLAETGLCTECGWEPVMHGLRTCHACRMRIAGARIYPSGDRCRKCNGPRDSELKTCTACRERDSKRSRQRYWERVNAGLCVECTAPRNLYASLCDECRASKRSS